MPSKNPAQPLQDNIDNIDAVRSFVGEGSVENLVGDLKTRYAVERALEIISEASRRLPDDLRQRHRDIDWRALAGLGNVYRHDYDMIEAHLMWESIEQRLEPLRKVAEQELRQLLGQ
jgi:uncharacterized protein with HEPN domain